MPHAADEREPVLLEAHPRPPPEAEPASGQFVLDLVLRHGEAGRETFDDDDEALTVGLSRGEEAQHKENPTLPGGSAWPNPVA